VSWRRLWGAHLFPLECVYYDAMSRSGASIEALEGITDVLAMAEQSQTNWWNAELYRLRGEIAARVRPDDPECEIWFDRAAQKARSQGAVLLELRALVSLGRFQKRRGGSIDATAELDAVLSKLPPSLAIADVRDARKLIADRAN
jgi:predicted ATPase